MIKIRRPLFTLGLNTITSKAVERKLIKGLNASKNVTINNLQYTDYTILFGQPTIQQR